MEKYFLNKEGVQRLLRGSEITKLSYVLYKLKILNFYKTIEPLSNVKNIERERYYSKWIKYNPFTWIYFIVFGILVYVMELGTAFIRTFKDMVENIDLITKEQFITERDVEIEDEDN